MQQVVGRMGDNKSMRARVGMVGCIALSALMGCNAAMHAGKDMGSGGGGGGSGGMGGGGGAGGGGGTGGSGGGGGGGGTAVHAYYIAGGAGAPTPDQIDYRAVDVVMHGFIAPKGDGSLDEQPSFAATP